MAGGCSAFEVVACDLSETARIVHVQGCEDDAGSTQPGFHPDFGVPARFGGAHLPKAGPQSGLTITWSVAGSQLKLQGLSMHPSSSSLQPKTLLQFPSNLILDGVCFHNLPPGEGLLLIALAHAAGGLRAHAMHNTY